MADSRDRPDRELFMKSIYEVDKHKTTAVRDLYRS